MHTSHVPYNRILKVYWIIKNIASDSNNTKNILKPIMILRWTNKTVSLQTTILHNNRKTKEINKESTIVLPPFITGEGGGGLQICGWNFYGPNYILEISKYKHINIFVCKKALYLYSSIRIS